MRTLWMLLVVLLAGCGGDLLTPIPFEGSRLVVYGFLSPDNDFSVRVSKTVPPSSADTLSYAVSPGMVVLHTLGGGTDTLTFDQDAGAYVTVPGWRPVSGRAYWLQVQVPDFPVLTSDTVRVPEPIAINGYTFIDSSRKSINTNQAIGEVMVNFQPAPGQDRYFFLAGESYEAGEMLSTLSGCLAGNVATSCVTSFDGFVPECIFPESCFLQFPVELGVWVTTSDVVFSGGNLTPVIFDSIVVRLRTLDPAMYQYYQTRYQPSDFELAFSEPGNVHSNMNGGYGLLGAYSESRVVIEL